MDSSAAHYNKTTAKPKVSSDETYQAIDWVHSPSSMTESILPSESAGKLSKSFQASSARVSDLILRNFQYHEPDDSQLAQYQALRDRRSRSLENIARAGNLRWLILLLSCFIMFGNYYAYDNPSALNRQLGLWMADGNDAVFEYKLSLLYTVYSAPNVILPFFIGKALDRLSSRYFLIGLSLAVCLGQSVFAIGIAIRSWPIMFLGRFIFGLGGESLAVAQSRLVTEWFMGHELSLALGLNLSIARIGTVVNNNMSPRVAYESSVTGAALTGLFACLFSLICTLVCILCDIWYRPEGSVASDLEDPTDESTFMLSRESLKQDLRRDTHLHPAFWLLMLVNFTSYGAVLCFNNVASAYLQARYYPNSVLAANWAMSLPDTLAIFLVPLLGLLVDSTGNKLNTVIVGQIALSIGHFTLSLGKEGQSAPFLPLSFLGIGYSTLLAIWSCVPSLAGTLKQATAYGFLTAGTNFSVTILPLAVAACITSDQSYFKAGMFFSSLGAMGCLFIGCIYYLNSRLGLGLNSTRNAAHSEQSRVIVTAQGDSSRQDFQSFRSSSIKRNQIFDIFCVEKGKLC